MSWQSKWTARLIEAKTETIEGKKACAAIVPLHPQGNLRAFIGNLDAHQPFVKELAEYAFNAAFRDPQFPRVEHTKLASMEIEIAVLTPKERIALTTELKLIKELRPHRHVLIMQEGHYCCTFLPVF
ncbi:MAG: AMMECR1 domain-containing protein [Gammaproteobacteria bacterium]